MLVLFYPQVIRKHIAGLLTLIHDKNRSELEGKFAKIDFGYDKDQSEQVN
jgi:hypothetical protein